MIELNAPVFGAITLFVLLDANISLSPLLDTTTGLLIRYGLRVRSADTK